MRSRLTFPLLLILGPIAARRSLGVGLLTLTTAASLFTVPASAQTPTTITGSGGTVTTDAAAPAGVSITANATASNVKLTLGSSSTAAFHIFTSSGSELARFQTNGFLGIGTPAPNRKLDVMSNNDGITFGQHADNLQAIQTYVDGQWSDRSTYGVCCNGLLLQPDGGWVAIGTANPTGGYKLEVAGLVYSSTGGYRFPDGTIQTTASPWSRDAAQATLWTMDKVGIGAPAPGGKLVVVGDAPYNNGAGTRLQSSTVGNYFEMFLNASSLGYTSIQSFQEGVGPAPLLLQGMGGAVAIGTNSPGSGGVYDTPLTVHSNAELGTFIKVSNSHPAYKMGGVWLRENASNAGWLFGTDNGGNAVIRYGTGANETAAITAAKDGTNGLVIGTDGNVGIGQAPAAGMKLQVAGNAHFVGTVTGSAIYATYQDVAEWVPSNTDLGPGTVVVLDPSIGNGVMASGAAYDTAVAGVVSAQPGIILGVAGDDKEQIATTGRVRVRVDASRAPIRVGDLLVTSDTPGTAMRSEPMDIGGRKFHQPGTIIGKALEALEGGQGEILVLLSLQ